MLSVLILTYNEERNIGDCIKSLPWRADVHVLDSMSTDATVDLAQSLGAKVSHSRFAGYATQRNIGLSLPFENEWIVMLDADERMTEALVREIESQIGMAGPQDVMFRVRRKDIFMGRWLKRASGYPTWFPRVFRRDCVRVEREINEVYVTDGRTIKLQEHLIHYPFNKGIDWWFERHNAYSTKEASLVISGQNPLPPLSLASFTDPGTRRATLKAVFYRLPLRPFLTFLYLMVVRGGFLDGYPGFVFASMRLSYEIMIDAKVAYARAAKS